MIARILVLSSLLCAQMVLAQDSESIPSVSVSADPITGTVDLSGGSQARFSYDFDHNALTDGVLAGQFLLAITDSGNLLEFDAKSLVLSGQAIVPGRAVSIARETTDSALIGTLDGHIYRVRSGSLQLETITSTSGSVVWLSTRHSSATQSGSVVFVVDRSPDVRPWPGEAAKAFNARERAATLRVANTYAVEVFEHGRLRELPFPKLRFFTIPGHYLLDSHDRLWMGADNGEWGGKCYYMNLRTGMVHTLKDNINGVLGFFLTPNGSTIVYGGLAHLGMYEGYIAEARSGDIKYIAKFQHDSLGPIPPGVPVTEEVLEAAREVARRKAQESKDKPNGPIDLIEADSRGGYWVVSEHVLFHAGDEFKSWQRITELGGRWISGRRFSMGGTPTINQLIDDPTQSNHLLAVMGKDGLERISNGMVERHSFAGQLESAVLDIWKTSNGTMFVGAYFDDRSLWRQQGGHWRRYSLFPDHPPADDGTQWSFAEPFGNDGSRIAAFAHDNLGDGTAFIVELDENKAARVVDSWPGDSSQFETAFLVTSNGIVLKTVDKKLFKRSGKDWLAVGTSDYYSSLDRRGTLHGREFVLLGTTSSSDIFLETEHGDLFQLNKTSKGSDEYNLRLARFSSQPAPVAIFDAVPEENNRVLLTTARGILEVNLETGNRRAIPSPNGREAITSVCRDGQHRLWAVGDFLYLSSDEGQHWTTVNLPMLVHTSPKRLRLYPETPSKMIVTLAERGLLTIDLQ